MGVQVKICGVRDVAGAKACRDAGADLVGFNFVPSSKRFVCPSTARTLVSLVGSERAVGVFRDQDEPSVMSACLEAGVRWVQLHGGESRSRCESLRARGFRVIKALSITTGTTAEQIGAYGITTDLLLFDAAVPGSGKAFDHDLLAALRPAHPFLLAGGLHPGNVAEAIRSVAPDGVDTASGVERGGKVDPSRVAAFCRAAREARHS